MNALSHEEPLLLVLPPSAPVEEALPRILADPELRHVAYPPLWVLDKAGVDLPAAVPQLRTLTLETLEEGLRALLGLCDETQLRQLVARVWGEVDERVRQHYLGLGIAQSFAQIFKIAPSSRHREPPPAFRRDRIHENGLEFQYRLAPGAAEGDRSAPPEEGSLVLYPFDPANAEARTEAALGEGSGAILEVFAYETGRERHLAYWQGAAARNGWQLVDPRAR